ncbi:MAG: UbiA prenyltransferase family protein [Candidatus Aenigmarchaeota archaeon]|nr:UbiA prenyltransferase family protein [Candidatus Aenigmarchaeota archaeon]
MLKISEFASSFGLVLAGFLLAAKHAAPDLLHLTYLGAAFLMLGSSAFLLNDYFDYEHDKHKGRRLRQKMERGKIFFLAAGLFLAGALISSLLPQKTFYLLVLTYAATFVYSAQPFRFKEKFLLDFTFHGIVGPLLILTGYSAVSEINLPIIALSVPQFFMFANSAILQQMRDIKADKKAGFNTTAIKFANPVRIAQAFIVLAAASLVAAVLLFYPPYFMLFVAALLPYFPALFREGDYYRRNYDATKQSALIFIAVSAAVFYLYFM